MAKSSLPKELLPDLPSLEDRIPELVEALENASRVIKKLDESHTYFPAWESLYKKAHSLKGLAKLLPGDEIIANNLEFLSDTLAQAYSGNYRLNNYAAASEILAKLARKITFPNDLYDTIDSIQIYYDSVPNEAERKAILSMPLPSINSIAGRKAFEAMQLNLPTWTIEESGFFNEFMNWCKRLEAVLQFAKGGEALMILTVPILTGEKSNNIQAWGWVAGAMPKQDLKDALSTEFPQAKIKEFTFS